MVSHLCIRQPTMSNGWCSTLDFQSANMCNAHCKLIRQEGTQQRSARLQMSAEAGMALYETHGIDRHCDEASTLERQVETTAMAMHLHVDFAEAPHEWHAMHILY